MQKFNVIDIESTCWSGEVPAGWREEIIEIGVVSVDLDARNILSSFSHLLMPKESGVSEYCERLTGITEEMLVEEGLQFPLVMQSLQALCEIHDRPWGSWGEYDLNKLKEECDRQNVSRAISGEHYNIKEIDQEDEDLAETKSLQTSLNRRKIERVGDEHRAMSDALGAACILLETDFQIPKQ